MPAAPYLQRVANARAALSRERELRARDAWTPERLADHQAERLGELVRHAVARSAFYRERFAGIDTSGPIDLAALPPVRKDELMERFDDWVCDPRLRRDAVERHLAGAARATRCTSTATASWPRAGRPGGAASSSSTPGVGRAVRADAARAAVPRRDAEAAAATALATVLAPSAAHMTWRISASMDFGLHRNLRLAVTQPMDEIVRELNAFRPDYLAAYPSIGALLAEEQLAGRLRISPSTVSTSSEVCTPEMRERMRARLGRRAARDLRRDRRPVGLHLRAARRHPLRRGRDDRGGRGRAPAHHEPLHAHPADHPLRGDRPRARSPASRAPAGGRRGRRGDRGPQRRHPAPARRRRAAPDPPALADGAAGGRAPVPDRPPRRRPARARRAARRATSARRARGDDGRARGGAARPACPCTSRSSTRSSATPPAWAS